jgi:hypothetical protein
MLQLLLDQAVPPARVLAIQLIQEEPEELAELPLSELFLQLAERVEQVVSARVQEVTREALEVTEALEAEEVAVQLLLLM